jgi:PKD repeat protein
VRLWNLGHCTLMALAFAAGCGGGGGGNPQPVNQAPDARFTGSASEGSSPLIVRFDASGSSDTDGSIEQFRWDFGAFGGVRTSTQPAITMPFVSTSTLTLAVPVTLTVTDDDGATDTAGITIELDPVSAAVIPLLTEPIDEGDHSSVAVRGDDAMAVSSVFPDSAPAQTQFMQVIEDGDLTQSPPVTISETNTDFNFLTFLNGLPVVLWHNTDGPLEIVHATAADGSGWEPPIEIEADVSISEGSEELRLLIADGNPAVAYRKDFPGDGFQIRFERAVDAAGTDWSAPPVEVASFLDDDPSGPLSVFEFDGRPAVVYYDEGLLPELRFRAANDAAGTSWSNFEVVTPGPYGFAQFSVAVFDGQPAVFFEADNSTVLAHRSPAGDWTSFAVSALAALDAGRVQLAVIDGLPHAFFEDSAGRLLLAIGEPGAAAAGPGGELGFTSFGEILTQNTRGLSVADFEGRSLLVFATGAVNDFTMAVLR